MFQGEFKGKVSKKKILLGKIYTILGFVELSIVQKSFYILSGLKNFDISQFYAPQKMSNIAQKVGKFCNPNTDPRKIWVFSGL